jgi:maltose-binding protein MalE
MFAALAVGLLLSGLALLFGCGAKTQTCTVTPIDIEEVNADTRGLDADVAETQVRLERAQAELASWQAKVADRKGQVPQLQALVDSLKQASGVSVDIVEGDTESQQAQSLDSLVPVRGAE